VNPKTSIVIYAARGMARFFARHPKLFIAAIAVYLLSPFDVLPEAFLGPAGFLDDALLLAVPFLLREYARKLTETEKPKSPKRPNDYFDTTAR
jgi:uncharacterized membrane protein YkvA (DUF1232 family)